MALKSKVLKTYSNGKIVCAYKENNLGNINYINCVFVPNPVDNTQATQIVGVDEKTINIFFIYGISFVFWSIVIYYSFKFIIGFYSKIFSLFKKVYKG